MGVSIWLLVLLGGLILGAVMVITWPGGIGQGTRPDARGPLQNQPAFFGGALPPAAVNDPSTGPPFVTFKTETTVISPIGSPGDRGYNMRRAMTVERETEYVVSNSNLDAPGEHLPQVGVTIHSDVDHTGAVALAAMVEDAIRADEDVIQHAAAGRWDAVRERAQTVAGDRAQSGVPAVIPPPRVPDPARRYDINVVVRQTPVSETEYLSDAEAAERYNAV